MQSAFAMLGVCTNMFYCTCSPIFTNVGINVSLSTSGHANASFKLRTTSSKKRSVLQTASLSLFLVQNV